MRAVGYPTLTWTWAGMGPGCKGWEPFLGPVAVPAQNNEIFGTESKKK